MKVLLLYLAGCLFFLAGTLVSIIEHLKR